MVGSGGDKACGSGGGLFYTLHGLCNLECPCLLAVTGSK